MSDKFMVFVPGSTSPPEAPLDLPELEARIGNGKLSDEAMVCLIGGEKWVKLAEVIKKKDPPPEPEPTKYEVKVGEKVVGPVTLDQIRRGIEAGKIPGDAQLRKVGDDIWAGLAEALVLTRPFVAPDPAHGERGERRRGTGWTWAFPRLPILVAGGAACVVLLAALAAIVARHRGSAEALVSGDPPSPAPSDSVAVTPPPPNLMLLDDFRTAWNTRVADLGAGAVRLHLTDTGSIPAEFTPGLSLNIETASGSRITAVTLTKGGSIDAALLGRLAFSVMVGVLAPGVDERGLIDELGMKAGSATTAVRGLTTFRFQQDMNGPEVISVFPTGAAPLAGQPTEVPAVGICGKLTPIVEELASLATDAAEIQPKLKRRNLVASGAAERFRNMATTRAEAQSGFKKATDAKAKFERIQAAPGEEPVRKDLISAYGAIAAAFDGFYTQLGRGTPGLSGFVQVATEANRLPTLISALRKELVSKCSEGALGNSASPQAAAPSTPIIQCRRTADIDDICESEGKFGYNCWGGTVQEVKEAIPSCVYLTNSRFCCNRTLPQGTETN